MKFTFNFESFREDVRKIGVALVVAAMLAALLKNSSFVSVVYPFVWGMILIFVGSLTWGNDRE